MPFNLDAMKTSGTHDGNHRSKLPIYASGSGFGNTTITMDHPMRELFISNDSDINDIELTVSGEAFSLEFTLKPNEVMDERFSEFNSISINAPDDWRWYVRSGRVA